jgi:hypothetical protein
MDSEREPEPCGPDPVEKILEPVVPVADDMEDRAKHETLACGSFGHTSNSRRFAYAALCGAARQCAGTRASLPANRSMRKGSIGRLVFPCVTSWAVMLPTTGPSWKPWPQNPKEWNTFGAALDGPI